MSNLDGIHDLQTFIALAPAKSAAAPVPRPARPSATVAYVALVSASLTLAIGVFVYIAVLGRNYHLLAALEAKAGAVVRGSAEPASDNVAPVGAIPDEQPLATAVVSGYAVAPDAPRYLKIERLRVMSRIIGLSESKAGVLLAPRSIYDAGWYTATSKPGTGGATLIDGHSTGPTKQGIFGKLDSLAAGDIISVVRGDGRTVSYRVVRKQHFPEKSVDMASAISPVTPGKAGLNLITCGGTVNTRTNGFSERIIVYAEAV